VITAVFLRVLSASPDKKGVRLARLASELRGEQSANLPDVTSVDPSRFSALPGSPFAYWVPSEIQHPFRELPTFEPALAEARQGLATADDFRFLRAYWEVEASEEQTPWKSFTKGGAYGLYYYDLSLVIRWGDDGRELKAWTGSLYGGSHWSRLVKNTDYYLRSGITWPLRTHSFSPRPLPENSIFSVRGYAAFPRSVSREFLLGLCGSSLFDYLFRTGLGRDEHPEFIVGTLKPGSCTAAVWGAIDGPS